MTFTRRGIAWHRSGIFCLGLFAALFSRQTVTSAGIDDPATTGEAQPIGDAPPRPDERAVDSSSDAERLKQAQANFRRIRAFWVSIGNPDGAEELLTEVTKQLTASPNDVTALREAVVVAQALEDSGTTDKLALRAYRDFGRIVAKSADPEIARCVKRWEPAVCRLELLGKPMTISCILLSGKPFDQAPLKGKVVLVEFWATWCGACLIELPKIEALYKKYHDQGFEVIGVSLDKDRAALEAFVESRKIPWAILCEADDANQSTAAKPLSVNYGIRRIPAAILIGTDGEVVSLHAHGPQLSELVTKLLEPAKNTVPASDPEKTE